MSLAVDLVDQILVDVVVAILDVTTRNALTEGFIDETQVSDTDHPFVQGFGVTTEAEPVEFGQSIARYTIGLLIVQDVDQGDVVWGYIDGILDQLNIDFTLNGLAERVEATAYGVDEVSDRNRTRGSMEIEVEVFR